MEILGTLVVIVFIASIISIYKNARYYIKKNMIELDDGGKEC